MAIDPKLIEGLLAGYKKAEDIVGENGLLKQLTKAILERALDTELTEHLGYEKHDPVGYKSGNSRTERQEPKEAERRFWGNGPGNAA
jgi:putative transposase